MRSDRALVVATGGGIGDSLLATIAARALRTRFRAVDALVLPAHAALIERVPDVERVVPYDGALLALAGRLRGERYAAAVVTWATLETALLPLLAGIPLRVGQSRRLYSGLFSRRVAVRSERGDHRSHWTQILLDYPRAIGCDTADTRPRVVPTSVDGADAAALLRTLDITGPYALLHPTRGLSAQHARWPTAGLATLAAALHTRLRLPVLITGSAGDAPIARAIADAAGPGAIAIGGTTSLGAFAALAGGAQVVVAMDSGPMHVAAATGAPTVGIFALQSDEPDRWAPLGERPAVVRARYPCPPEHRKETCPDFACVQQLDVAAILTAVEAIRVDNIAADRR